MADRLVIKLTDPDEIEWMTEVLRYGNEITQYMIRKRYLSKRAKDVWAAIQFELYRRYVGWQ